jgi:hypothetical protein
MNHGNLRLAPALLSIAVVVAFELSRRRDCLMRVGFEWPLISTHGHPKRTRARRKCDPLASLAQAEAARVRVAS